MGLMIHRAQTADEPDRIIFFCPEGNRLFQPDHIHPYFDAALIHAFVGHGESFREHDIRPILFNVLDHGVNVAFFNISQFKKLLR